MAIKRWNCKLRECVGETAKREEFWNQWTCLLFCGMPWRKLKPFSRYAFPPLPCSGRLELWQIPIKTASRGLSRLVTNISCRLLAADLFPLLLYNALFCNHLEQYVGAAIQMKEDLLTSGVVTNRQQKRWNKQRFRKLIKRKQQDSFTAGPQVPLSLQQGEQWAA